MTAELVCVGLATADTLIELPAWPDPDGRLLVRSMRRAGGGPAATAAVAAARLGRRVAFAGGIGDDPAGAAVRAGLEREGVDVRTLSVTDGPTSESVILLEAAAATRSILHAPGASLADLDASAMVAAAAATWVHVDHVGWGPAVRAGLPPDRLSVDAGNPVEGLILDGLGLYAPTARSLAERAGRPRLGDAMAAALAEGAHRVVVTMGEGGVAGAEGGEAWRIAGVRTQVRSTLGAGDVFHGALLAGLLDGRPLAEAARRANLAAALSCRGLDGREAIPTAGELDGELAGAPEPEPILLSRLR